MKPPYFLTITSMTVLSLIGTALWSAADPDPYRPVGTLQVNPLSVETGVKPNLSWTIDYPESVTDLVVINSDDSIVAQKDLCMDVRVVGAAWSDGRSYYKVNGFLKVFGNWIQLFYGTQNDIDASVVRYSQILSPNTRVDFAGRGHLGGGSWSDWMMTTSPTYNVKALVNGDRIPDYAPAYDQGDIASFLTQFVDDAGTVILGPYDIIYLFDFNRYGSSGFDLQDLVVVATFTEL